MRTFSGVTGHTQLILPDEIQKRLVVAQDVEGSAQDQVERSLNPPVFHPYFPEELQLQFSRDGPDGEDRDAQPGENGLLDRFRASELLLFRAYKWAMTLFIHAG